MRQNWYRIIGLNPDGKEAGKRYTKDEIKKAYHRKSLEWHPDKNQSADAKERFQQLKEARDFLMDDKKRKAFNKELKRSPDLFPDTACDLMLITRERPSPAPVASVPASPSTEMIIRPPQSPSINDKVNISDFFHHARADVIAYASSNPDLARAIFKNGRIVSALSLEKKYELMLVMNHHAALRQQQDGLENDFAREAASYLDSLENNHDNQQEFVTACCNQLSLAPSFYQAYPDIISGLDKKAFYRLASKSEEIVGPFLAMHADSLRPIQLAELTGAWPGKDIPGLYRKHASPEKSGSMDAYSRLEALVSEKKLTVGEITDEHQGLIMLAGRHVVDLPESGLKPAFLRILMEQRPGMMNDLDDRDRESITQDLLRAKGQLQENTIDRIIGNTRDEASFASFCQSVNLENLDEAAKQKAIDLVLNFRAAGEDEAPLFSGILDRPGYFHALLRNRELFLALIHAPAYAGLLASEENKKLFYILLESHRLTDDEIRAQPSEAIRNYAGHLGKLSVTMSADAFGEWVNEHGYPEGLLLREFRDIRIRAMILNDWLSTREPLMNVSSSMIQEVVCSASESGALLATCPKDKMELLFQAITDLAERKDRVLDKAITNALQDSVFFSRIPAWIIQEIADRDRDSSILLNPAAQDKLRMLDQWKEELKDADRGNLSPPQQQARLESLLELSKAIGIDRHLLQTIQASLVHQPVMQSDLYHRLLEIRPSLLSDTDRRNINTRIQEIENKLPLDRSPSHDAALRRIENDRDSITGSELMQFVREFGEPMRQVIRDEKLDDVLLYAEQLEKLWQPLKDKALVLEEKEIEKPAAQEEINAFWEALSSINPGSLSNQAITFQLYSSLHAHHPSDLVLPYLEAYPKENASNLLLWAIKLAQGDAGEIQDRITGWRENIDWEEVKPLLVESWAAGEITFDELDGLFDQPHIGELVPALIDQSSRLSGERMDDLINDPLFVDAINERLASQGSSFRWPSERLDRESNLVCQAVIHRKLSLEGMLDLSDSDLDKLNHPAIQDHLQQQLRIPSFKLSELLEFPGDLESFPRRNDPSPPIMDDLPSDLQLPMDELPMEGPSQSAFQKNEKPGGRALCMVDLLGSITGDEKWTRDFCEKHHLQIEKNAANPSARMTFVSRDPDCRIVLTKNKIGFSRMPGHEEMRISVPIMVDIYIRGIRDNHAELRHVCGCADPVVLDYMERTLAGKLLEQGRTRDKINGKGIHEILDPPIKQEKARHPHIS